MDFTDVKNVTLKDWFPLPNIDQLVDATVGSKHPRNEENTTSITTEGTYCYIRIPYRLKNVGVTYHRLVNRMFEK